MQYIFTLSISKDISSTSQKVRHDYQHDYHEHKSYPCICEDSKLCIFLNEISHPFSCSVHFRINQHNERTSEEFTNPAKMDGLAGRMTFTTLFNPLISNVAALSRYRLSMVIIPVMVANSVAHTIL